MKRQAHHRATNRTGPWNSWRQRVAPHLAGLFRAVRAGQELLRHDCPHGGIEYKAARLRARAAFERVAPLLADEDGSAWE